MGSSTFPAQTKTDIKPSRVVDGLTGGIAAYHVVSFVRDLVKRAADIQIVPTEAAVQFIGKPTLEAISINPINESAFQNLAEFKHVAFAAENDMKHFLDYSTEKETKNGANLLVANLVGYEEGYGSVPSSTLFIDKAGNLIGESLRSKHHPAQEILH